MQYQHTPDSRLPLVTVAMAVYNAMPYLPASIENVLHQTYQNIDFLIIDDASTDNSREIIEKYVNRDNRIRFIFKEKNEGLSSVRNISMKEAKGEYLLMIDADDLMDLTTISKAVNNALSTDADIVIWDYSVFYGNSAEVPVVTEESKIAKIEPHNRHALIWLPAFMPVRLLLMDYVRRKNFSFPLGLTKQDIPVHWAMVTDPHSRISLLPEVLFYYRQHLSSTTNLKGRSLFSLAKVMDIVGVALKDSNIYLEYRTDYLRAQLSHLHGMYDSILPEYKSEAMSIIKDRFDEDAKQFISENGKVLSCRVRWFYKMIEGSVTSLFLYETAIIARKIYRRLYRH